ncbi:MAG: NAD-dependent epimerase/dehydratase family protein [Chloroflexota bacterium]
MKAFVTGATGFIGKRLVHRLVERGDQVVALVRSPEAARAIQAMGASAAIGDILDFESMQAGMLGCDVVFHLAGWYKLGARDIQPAEAINVQGTLNVLGLAHQLGVPRIIYTSTIAVLGDTQGYVADETYQSQAEHFLTEYDRTKWMAHYKVALPLIAKGAPVIILMPGAVYGPGDPSLVGDIMRLFYRGFLPVLPGPELTLTFAHVDDVAEGHLLAAEKGKPGESYLLTGPILSLGQVAQVWAEISGRRAPVLQIPARFIKLLAPIVAALGAYLPLPAIISKDAIAILEATYIACADKAQAELGWQARPVEEGMRQTFDALAKTIQPVKLLPQDPARCRQLAGAALGAAIGLLLAWWITRRRK